MTPTERPVLQISAVDDDELSSSAGSTVASPPAGSVEAVFDPAVHKVLYELGSLPQDCEDPRILVRRGSGLSALAGCLDARRRLGQEHWVVLVADDAAWQTGLGRVLSRLQQVVARVLLIVPAGPHGAAGRRVDPDPEIAVLRGSGWSIVELAEPTTAEEFAAELSRLRDRAAPGLVFASPDLLAGISRSVVERCRREQRVPPGGACDRVEALLGELQRRMQVDLRITPVVGIRDAAWRSLAERHPGRVVVVGPQEVSGAIPWCGAMSRAGCHPVMVIGVRSFMRHRQSLAREWGSQPARATIIVLDDPAAGLDRFSPLPDLDGRMVSVHADAGTAVSMLSACLEARHPALLYVAMRPIRTQEEWIGPGAGGDEPRAPARGAAPRRHSTDEEGGRVHRSRNPETRQIRSFQFSEFERRWIRGYRRVGKRDLYLWRWTGCAVDWLTLSCVKPELRRGVCETKLLAAMFNVLLDDLIDQRHDPDAMRDVMRLMSDDAAAAAVVSRLGAYGEFTRRVWCEIWTRAAGYPRFKEFQRLLLYDFKQLGNTVDYSELLYRHPSLINETEHDLYSPHGMMVACAATLDLMCSPDFEVEELGRLREVLWHANSMARIGNLMTTWQREIGDDDFSSGVFAHAVSGGWLTPDDLSSANRDRIEAAVRESGGEREYAERWRRHRERLMEMSNRLRSVSVKSLAEGLERLFASELVSRGRK